MVFISKLLRLQLNITKITTAHTNSLYWSIQSIKKHNVCPNGKRSLSRRPNLFAGARAYMRPCKISCTYECHLGLILEYLKKGQKSLGWGVFGLPLTHIVKILQKIKSVTSHITHHTSHITYYIGICKFYKLLLINTVVNFNNS